MSILDDIYNANNLLDSIKDIRRPEDLQQTIQGGKDIFDKYITDLKNIPAELERWQDVAKDLGFLSENTDFVNDAKDLLFKTALDNTTGIFKEGIGGLKNIMSSNVDKFGVKIEMYSVGGIKIDYLYEVSPTYETYTVTQPIISKSNLDVLSEDAENTNPSLKFRCILKGNDKQTRFDNLNSIRESKKILQVVANKLYDKMLITRLKPIYTNTEDLEFEIELEEVFVAQLKRTEAKKETTKTANKAKSKANVNKSVSKNMEPLVKIPPIPPQQKPDIGMNDYVKNMSNLGFVTPVNFTSYEEYEKRMYKTSYIGGL